jgi:uncharacterized protein YegP (UPF0339 family)
MIPIVTFYLAPSLDIQRFYKPTDNECKLIQRFIDQGINPIINALTPCNTNTITSTTGFYWVKGADELSFTCDWKGEEIFMLVYFNGATFAQVEGYKSQLEDIMGLATFKRKGELLPPIEKPIRLEQTGGSVIETGEPVGDRVVLARVEGGEHAEKVTRLLDALRDQVRQTEWKLQ